MSMSNQITPYKNRCALSRRSRDGAGKPQAVKNKAQPGEDDEWHLPPRHFICYRGISFATVASHLPPRHVTRHRRIPSATEAISSTPPGHLPPRYLPPTSIVCHRDIGHKGICHRGVKPPRTSPLGMSPGQLICHRGLSCPTEVSATAWCHPGINRATESRAPSTAELLCT